jgi:hypothetical protein
LLKDVVFWDVAPRGCNGKSDVSEEHFASSPHRLSPQGKKTVSASSYIVGLLFLLFFVPEYGGYMYLRNVG